MVAGVVVVVVVVVVVILCVCVSVCLCVWLKKTDCSELADQRKTTVAWLASEH